MYTARDKSAIGLIGLAVMGQNLARNIEEHGFAISVYNRTTAKTKDFIARWGGAETRFKSADTLAAFVASLARPRKVFLMVKAGAPVDSTITELLPLLDEGDIIIDGGNSFFRDTERREAELAAKGIRFLGVGVSGGEEGALTGPSIMPGGSRAAYDEVKDILEAIAAQVDGSPCCAYMGPGGAGHFVKMVHNGIEYGDMELIAEAYFMMKELLGLPNERMADIFARWNEGPLQSFLIEITATILRRRDGDSSAYLIDAILDKAGQKGTGRWTAQCALDLGVPIPTIDAAIQGRVLSSYKDERLHAATILEGPKKTGQERDVEGFVTAIHDGLYASKICSYAQGMAMLRSASAAYQWSLDLATTARIWRAGCIIRARFLDDVAQAFTQKPALVNLLLDDFFRAAITKAGAHWRQVVIRSVEAGLPSLAFSASLGYFDAYRRERLSANMIQAQRDCFGAHRYERIDREGTFHSNWDAAG